MVRRSSFIFLVVSTCLFFCSSSARLADAGDARQQAPEQQTLSPQDGSLQPYSNNVCAHDQAEALKNALERHQSLIAILVRTKGLPENRRLETDPKRFQAAVQTFLNSTPDSALILYALDREFLCAFLWSGDQAPIYVRTANSDINMVATAKQFSSNIITRAAQRSPAVAERVATLRDVSDIFEEAPAPGVQGDASETLSGLLFPAAFWPTLAKTKHLSIVPVGSISSMPIGALNPLGTPERVVDRFSVNLLLFASEISAPIKTWNSDFKRSLVIGNPAGSDVFWRHRPIHQAEKEAIYVARKYGGEPLLGPNATSIAFIRKAADADLIYLATHGIAGIGNSYDPLRDSYLLLSDNRMPAATIRDFARDGGLKARLVVLSACQTGLGRVTEGGVVGLARTFLDAGAGNVVMTTWNVDDEATRSLMEKFVDLLDQHQPAEALRRAQLEAIGNYPDPVFWAAFNTYGNPFAGN